MIEPRAEFIFSHIGSDDLTTSNGVPIQYDSVNSTQGIAGINIGQKKDENTLYYLKTAFVHEFDGKGDTTYAGTKITSDPSGTRGLIGAGFNVTLNKKTYVYFDINLEKGSHVESVGGNIGVRYNW